MIRDCLSVKKVSCHLLTIRRSFLQLMKVLVLLRCLNLQALLNLRTWLVDLVWRQCQVKEAGTDNKKIQAVPDITEYLATVDEDSHTGLYGIRCQENIVQND